jgi:hypothetical protein
MIGNQDHPVFGFADGAGASTPATVARVRSGDEGPVVVPLNFVLEKLTSRFRELIECESCGTGNSSSWR